MKRLTNEEVRVDESMDRYLGPLSVLEGMKPKLLDLILNGPVLNGVSKDVLRQIIRQLYSALAAYEDTRLEPEEIDMDHEAAEQLRQLCQGCDLDRLEKLAEADKDGRLVVLPCGTDVELIRDGYAFKADHWNHTLTAFRDAPENKSGKQVALFSIKEAKEALAQEGGKDHA